MSKDKKSNSFEEKIQTTIKMGIPQPRKEFKNQLNARLTEQSFLEKSKKKDIFSAFTLKSKRTVAFSAALLVLVITLLVGPQKIYAVLQNLLKYIPGIGFVEPNRELIEPVTVEREGINLTVQEMVVNDDETILIYHVENIPNDKQADYSQENLLDESIGKALVNISYLLKIEGGETFQGESISGYTPDKWDGSEWTGKVRFPALPPNITEVQFLMSYLPNIYPDMAPQDWVVSVFLDFTDETIESASSYQSSFTSIPPKEDEYSELKRDVSLFLNAVSVSEEQIAMEITMNWTRENWVWLEFINFHCNNNNFQGSNVPHYLSLRDANGIEIPLNVENSEKGSLSMKSNTLSFSGDIGEVELESPLTLVLHGVNITTMAEDEDIPTSQYDREAGVLVGVCEESPYRNNNSNTLYGSTISFMSGSSTVTTGDHDHGLKKNKFERLHGLPNSEPIRTVITGTYHYELPAWPDDDPSNYIDFTLGGPWSIEFDLP